MAGEESLNLRRKTVGHLRDYYDEICSVTRAAVEMDPSEVAAAKALRLEQLSNHDAHPTAKGPEQHTDQQYGATLEPMPQAAFGQSDPSLWDTMDVSTDMEMCESAPFRFPLPSASLQQQPMIVSTASTHRGVCTGCGLAPTRTTGHTRELKNTKCPLPTCKCGRLKAVHRRFMVGPRCNLQPLDSNTGLAQRHTRLPDAEPTTSLAAPAQRHTRLPDAEPTTVKGRSARGLCSGCGRVPTKATGHTRSAKHGRCPLATCRCGRLKSEHVGRPGPFFFCTLGPVDQGEAQRQPPPGIDHEQPEGLSGHDEQTPKRPKTSGVSSDGKAAPRCLRRTPV